MTVKIKDPFDRSPDFLVPRAHKIPRWQNDWLNNHKSINYSGLCKEILTQMIKEHDPEYYEKYKEYVCEEMRRKETTPIPKIKITSVSTY